MHKIVDGQQVELTPAEIAEAQAAKLAWEAGEGMRQIKQLEAEITPRRMREALLGIDNGWLAEQNEAIKKLRL